MVIFTWKHVVSRFFSSVDYVAMIILRWPCMHACMQFAYRGSSQYGIVDKSVYPVWQVGRLCSGSYKYSTELLPSDVNNVLCKISHLMNSTWEREKVSNLKTPHYDDAVSLGSRYCQGSVDKLLFHILVSNLRSRLVIKKIFGMFMLNIPCQS